jgi:hypothetical protein
MASLIRDPCIRLSFAAREGKDLCLILPENVVTSPTIGDISAVSREMIEHLPED